MDGKMQKQNWSLSYFSFRALYHKGFGVIIVLGLAYECKTATIKNKRIRCLLCRHLFIRRSRRCILVQYLQLIWQMVRGYD